MNAAALTLLATACELLLGGLLWPRRLAVRSTRALRRHVEARRALRVSAPPATAAGLIASVWLGLVDPPSTAGWVLQATMLAPGMLASCGSLLLLRSARLERRGRVAAARRAVRSGGLALSLGAPGIAMAGLPLVLHPDPAVSWSRWLAAAGLVAAAAFVSLLAGLSRKPRPSGPLAVLLCAAGRGLLALSVRSG